MGSLAKGFDRMSVARPTCNRCSRVFHQRLRAACVVFRWRCAGSLARCNPFHPCPSTCDGAASRWWWCAQTPWRVPGLVRRRQWPGLPGVGSPPGFPAPAARRPGRRQPRRRTRRKPMKSFQSWLSSSRRVGAARLVVPPVAATPCSQSLMFFALFSSSHAGALEEADASPPLLMIENESVVPQQKKKGGGGRSLTSSPLLLPAFPFTLPFGRRRRSRRDWPCKIAKVAGTGVCCAVHPRRCPGRAGARTAIRGAKCSPVLEPSDDFSWLTNRTGTL